MKARLIIALTFSLFGSPLTCKAADAPSAEVVVAEYLRYQADGDVPSIDALFYRIPQLDAEEAGWLALIRRVVDRVEEEQLAWEVVCSKELAETAVVIVNQTMKGGKPHGDPDALYLTRDHEQWKLLPEILAPNTKKPVEAVLGNGYKSDRLRLRWVIGEIRGLTSDCASPP